MIIFNSIEINNIGVFKNHHYFDLNIDLNSKDKKNIILFGGKNGSGKSTFMEAIKLCLYGNTYYGYNKTKYKEFISNLISEGATEGAISIEINSYNLGLKEIYKVYRGWSFGKDLNEQFKLYKNNELLNNVTKNLWQDFINNLIPRGLVNFFFFDGEKLEALAKGLNDKIIAKDIRDLLGITLLNQLHLYLKHIKTSRLQDKMNNDDFNSKLSGLRKDLQNIELLIEQCHQEISLINSKLLKFNNDLKKKEDEFIAEGGNFARNYEKLKLQKESLCNRRDSLINDIKNYANGILPLLSASDLIEELIEQLKIEKKIQEYMLKQQLLDNKYSEVLNLLKEESVDNDRIINRLRDIFKESADVEGNIIHGLTDSQFKEIEDLYSKISNEEAKNILLLFSNLDEIEKQILEVDFAIQSKPNDAIIAPYLQDLSNISKEIANLQQAKERKTEELKHKQNLFTLKSNEIAKIEEQMEAMYKGKTVINLIDKTNIILKEFTEIFKMRKTNILRKEILLAFSILEKKSDLINDIVINKETFEITLYDRNHKKISVKSLSAGERQIFATSFLWGLIKTSGQSLPVIIDTPLGRLDGDHRENFALNYFPNISHQTIILSTDKEVDKELLKLMQNKINKSYTLQFDNNSGSTIVNKGYFDNLNQLSGININEI